jgi:hypothetical protein
VEDVEVVARVTKAWTVCHVAQHFALIWTLLFRPRRYSDRVHYAAIRSWREDIRLLVCTKDDEMVITVYKLITEKNSMDMIFMFNWICA